MKHDKIWVVKRVEKNYHKFMDIDPTYGYHNDIQRHINILKNVNINYWDIREKVVSLANLSIDNAGLKYIIDTVDEFTNKINELKNEWVFFTDDDDWVDNNIKRVLLKAISNNQKADCIVWPHVRYHALTNIITGNKKIDPNYNPTPKLQTNHCLIKITDKFLNVWRPELSIKDKIQHWNLNDYIFENPELKLNILKIPEFLSLWNNTPISFSWNMHPEMFSIEEKNNLLVRIANYSLFFPMRSEHLVNHNLNTSYLNYIYAQQQFFKPIYNGDNKITEYSTIQPKFFKVRHDGNTHLAEYLTIEPNDPIFANNTLL